MNKELEKSREAFNSEAPIEEKLQIDMREKWLFNFDDMLNAEPLTRIWKFIVKGVMNAIVASSEAGKSTFIRNFALAIITKQKQFLGWDLILENNSVLIISTEDGLSSQKEWFEPLVKIGDIKKEQLRFIVDNYQLKERLEYALNEHPTDLVFIDTWGDAASGFYTNEVTRELLNEVKTICNRYNSTMVVVHHTNKSSENIPDKTAIKGASDFEQMARVVLMIVKHKDSRWLCLVKGNNFDDDEKKVCYRLDFDPVEKKIHLSSDTMDRHEMIRELSKGQHTSNETVIDWISLFDGKELRRVELLKKISEQSGLSEQGARKRVERMIDIHEIKKLKNGLYGLHSV